MFILIEMSASHLTIGQLWRTVFLRFFLALMTVTGNAFVLAAIWRNPTLRTPSHVLLAGLAFTDFCTGLITLPLTAAYKLAH